MNSMFDRLGEYLKDYINDDEQGIFSSPEDDEKLNSKNEPNINTEEFSKKEPQNNFSTNEEKTENLNTEFKTQKTNNFKTETSSNIPKKRYYVPFELHKDFKTLCLLPGTCLEDCKIAYKNLLKKYHPDKYANEPEKQKETTEITSSITSAFTRIKTWYEENLPKF